MINGIMRCGVARQADHRDQLQAGNEVMTSVLVLTRSALRKYIPSLLVNIREPG